MSELPTALGAGKPPSAPAVRYDLGVRLRANSEYVAIPVFALLMAAILFALFLLAIGKSPVADGGAVKADDALRGVAALTPSGIATILPDMGSVRSARPRQAATVAARQFAWL